MFKSPIRRILLRTPMDPMERGSFGQKAKTGLMMGVAVWFIFSNP